MIHHLIARLLPFFPKKFVWLFSRRYISGRDVEDAVNVAHALNDSGSRTTVDYLGEFVSVIEQCRQQKDIYLNLIRRLHQEELEVNISLKPSSFVLLIDFQLCHDLVREVVSLAADSDRRVRIDMEDFQCVDREIELYRRLHAVFPYHVGLAVQSYLRRTESDLRRMIHWHSAETPLNFRLCKGIYQESETIVYTRREEINQRFLADLEFLFSHGIYVAIATHDKALVKGACDLITRYELLPHQYEFQMLYGVTPDLRAEIINQGHPMRVYVPYGDDWFGYSTRRLKENPKMVGQIIKALFIRG